jgi:hypothetical protein
VSITALKTFRLQDALVHARRGGRRISVRAGALGLPHPVARFASTLLIGAVLAWLSWPNTDLHPAPGLDPSWNAGLYLAADHGLVFGRDVLFTYGPLGFLAIPQLFFSSLARIAGLYVGVIQLAMCATFFWAARRSLNAVAAAVVAFVIAKAQLLPPTTAVLPALAFIFSIELLRDERRMRLVQGFAVTTGFVSALGLLVEFNAGVGVFAVGLATVIFLRDRIRATAIFLASFFVSFLLLWIASRQPLYAISPFLVRSIDISTGYSDAMGVEIAGRAWTYAAAWLTIVVFLAVGVVATREWPAASRLKAIVVAAALVIPTFKHGFVRHDAHDIGFFATMAGATVALAWAGPRRAYAYLAITGMIFAVLATSQASWRLFDPYQSAHLAVDQLKTMLTRDRFAVINESREKMRRQYALDPATIQLLTGKTVHISPLETGVAWAYPEFSWRPEPVFQSYAAYTPSLDRFDAQSLKGARSPTRILRNGAATIDGRLFQWEAPRSVLQMLCRYLEVRSTATWEVLARVRDRCGTPRLISTKKVHSGDVVAIPRPRPGRALFVRVQGLAPSGFERLRALFYKLGDRVAIINGRKVFRLVPDNASGPLLLFVPRHADYSLPYRLSLDVTTVAFVHGDSGSSSHAPLDLQFYELPISGVGVAAARS